MIVELEPGRDYLKKYMDREIYFIQSGSGDMHLEHVALIPKQGYLTVSLVGPSIDSATFPRDTRAIVKALFSLRSFRSILP